MGTGPTGGLKAGGEGRGRPLVRADMPKIRFSIPLKPSGRELAGVSWGKKEGSSTFALRECQPTLFPLGHHEHENRICNPAKDVILELP